MFFKTGHLLNLREISTNVYFQIEKLFLQNSFADINVPKFHRGGKILLRSGVLKIPV